jgi:hypothetical protein
MRDWGIEIKWDEEIKIIKSLLTIDYHWMNMRSLDRETKNGKDELRKSDQNFVSMVPEIDG